MQQPHLGMPSPEAVALLMREVICEQIYRERAKWNADHPNKALGIRTIKPEEVVPFARNGYLALSGDHLKLVAADVLDKIILARTP